MKKKKMELSRKLILSKSVITNLDSQTKVLGGGQTESYGLAQNCVCWKDPHYTEICPTVAPAMTCNEGLCQIRITELSCQAGPGCAAATLTCAGHGPIA